MFALIWVADYAFVHATEPWSASGVVLSGVTRLAPFRGVSAMSMLPCSSTQVLQVRQSGCAASEGHDRQCQGESVGRHVPKTGPTRDDALARRSP